ncbi:MAG: hypothetical protein IPK85_03360 [Gemmatimonadetes bacterium]|nr:hypothetical protein [Gemmatimonadota bacterium]
MIGYVAVEILPSKAPLDREPWAKKGWTWVRIVKPGQHRGQMVPASDERGLVIEMQVPEGAVRTIAQMRAALEGR